MTLNEIRAAYEAARAAKRIAEEEYRFCQRRVERLSEGIGTLSEYRHAVRDLEDAE